MSWIWNSNKIETIFEREDVHGNKILNVSRLGIHCNLRYIEINQAPKISVTDLLSMFGDTNKSLAETWTEISEDIKSQVYVYMHDFKNDPLTTEIECSHMCVGYIDAVKLLWGMQLDNMTKSKNIEVFLIYYQIRFFQGRIKTNSPKYVCDCLFNYLILGAILVGALGTLGLLYACNLLKR